MTEDITMVLIYDTYIGCQEMAYNTWTPADEHKVGLLTKLFHLLKH
jgi:hypothetical protein